MDLKRYYQQAEEICRYGRMVYQRGFADGNGGNISVRLSDHLFLCTPTMFGKGDLTPDDLCLVSSGGDRLEGRYRPSSEFSSHLAVYHARPEVKAVIHTHPPYCCSYAFSDSVPAPPLSPESAIWMGQLTMLGYYPPGAPGLAAEIENNARGKQVLLLRNHGLIAWGPNLREAWWKTEVTESHCKVSHLITARGAQPHYLNDEELQELYALADRMK